MQPKKQKPKDDWGSLHSTHTEPRDWCGNCKAEEQARADKVRDQLSQALFGKKS